MNPQTTNAVEAKPGDRMRNNSHSTANGSESATKYGAVICTWFPDTFARSRKKISTTWQSFCEQHRAAKTRASKKQLPLIGGYIFGDTPTENGALRHGANVLEITMLIGDYDAGLIRPALAAERLRAAGVCALVVTTSSHSDDLPRWRVFTPLSRHYPPDQFQRLMAMVNGALGGILAGESFSFSQSFYAGRVVNVPYEVLEVEGEPIDQREGSITPIYKDGGTGPYAHRACAPQEPVTDKQIDDLRSALGCMVQAGFGVRNPDWVWIGQALKSGGECLHDLWIEISDLIGNEQEPNHAELKWHQLRGERTGIAAIFKKAASAEFGWKNPRSTAHVETAGGGFDEYQDPISRDVHEGFYAHLQSGQYIDRITGDHWPAKSVNVSVKVWHTQLEAKKDRKGVEIEVEVPILPSQYLDKHRPVHQTSWLPGEPELVKDVAIIEAGEIPAPGNVVFNLYRPPGIINGDARLAGRWLDHIHGVYPDQADHIIKWFAHSVQHAAGKINHALVLIGPPGVGKDTMLEVPRLGVGPWNWSDIAPPQLAARFNGYRRAKIIRVNEAHDTGDDLTRHGLYEATKTLIAAPPDTLLVDEKNRPEYCIPNRVGVVFTSNHATDALYLPADDRRHFVAATNVTKEQFSGSYWSEMWQWYESGGIGHGVAYLRSRDITRFNAKAPPPLTQAFWVLVAGGEAPEAGEMRDLIDLLGKPTVLTLDDLVRVAEPNLAAELRERGKRRQLPHKLARVEYLPVRNPDTEDGLWRINNKRQAVYGKQSATFAEQLAAMRRRQ